MKKIVPLFEDYIESELLTAGQKSALAQGKDLVTKSQHALCYLIAKGRKDVLRQPFNKFDSNSELVAHAGLNPETAKHRVIEYEVLMGKREPRVGDEHLVSDRESELIHKYFNEFENMKPQLVSEIADESFTAENEQLGMAKLMDLRNRQKASNTKTKQNRVKLDSKIKDEIKFTLDGLRALHKVGENTKNVVIKRVAAKMGVPEAQVKSLYSQI